MIIQVISYDPKNNIITIVITINGVPNPPCQATPPSNLYSQSDWNTWLATVIQPLVDAIIIGKAYDPNQLVQIPDLSQIPGILTPAEIAAIQSLFGTASQQASQSIQAAPASGP